MASNKHARTQKISEKRDRKKYRAALRLLHSCDKKATLEKVVITKQMIPDNGTEKFLVEMKFVGDATIYPVASHDNEDAALRQKAELWAIDWRTK